MIRAAAIASLSLTIAITAAPAARAEMWDQWQSSTQKDLADLIEQGYEVKAAFPDRGAGGNVEIAYVQKGNSLYRCKMFSTENASVMKQGFKTIGCIPLTKPFKR